MIPESSGTQALYRIITEKPEPLTLQQFYSTYMHTHKTYSYLRLLHVNLREFVTRNWDLIMEL